MQIFVDGYCKSAKNFFDYPFLILKARLNKDKTVFCFTALCIFLNRLEHFLTERSIF